MDERSDIRFRLMKHNLSFTWLIAQLRLRGVVTDKSVLSATMNGSRNGPKSQLILETAKAVLDSYEQGSVLVATNHERRHHAPANN